MADYLSRIAVLIGADATELRTELDQAQQDIIAAAGTIEQRIEQMGVAIGAGLAAAAGALGFALNSAIDRADQLDDIAEKLGTSSGRLSQLQFAAEQSGASLDLLGVGLGKLNKLAAEAANGNDRSAATFAALGISVRDSSGAIRDSQDLFEDVAEAISSIQDPAAQAAVAIKFFGKSGGELVPLLTSDIAKLRQQAVDLGIAFTDDATSAAGQFNDALAQAQLTLSIVGVEILNKSAPAVAALGEGIATVARIVGTGFSDAIQFAADNVEELTAAAILAAGVIGSQYARTAVVTAIAATRAFIVPIVANTAAFLSYAASAGVAAAASRAFGAGLALVGGPLGALVLGASALGAALYYFRDSNSAAVITTDQLRQSIEALNAAQGQSIDLSLEAAEVRRAEADASLAALSADLERLRASNVSSLTSGAGPIAGLAGTVASATEQAIQDQIDQQIELIIKLDEARANAELRRAEYADNESADLARSKVDLEALLGTQRDSTKQTELEAAAQKKLSDAFGAAAAAINAENARLKEQAGVIAALRREMNPLLQAAEEYRDKLVAIAEQEAIGALSTAEAAEQRAFLNQQYQNSVNATQAAGNALGQLLLGLDAEIADTQALIAARKVSEAAYRTEAEVIREVNRLRAAGKAPTDEEIRQIRERVGVLEKTTTELEDIGRQSPGIFGALSDAITAAFSGDGQAAVDGFFASIKRQAAEAKGGLAGLFAEGLQTVAGIADAVRNSNGNAVGSGLRSLTSTLAATGNPIAIAASAIDSIFGGRLFGTDYQQTASGVSISGFDGESLTFEERQRALFGGTRRRTTRGDLDSGTSEFLAQLQKEVETSNAILARSFSTNVIETLSGSFEQITDKDGKITKQISTFFGVVYEEGLEAWAKRTVAENRIASIDAILGTTVARVAASVGADLAEGFVGGVGGSGGGRNNEFGTIRSKQLQALQGEASAIAERWRQDAETLLAGSEFLLAAALDIKAGTALLGADGSLTDIADLIEELNFAGETLVQTYARTAGTFQLLDGVLVGLGLTTELTREGFVRLAAGVSEALGGLEATADIIARNIGAYLTIEEQRQIRLTAAQAQLARIGVDAGIEGTLTAEQFRPILEQALAGAFSPERTAAILRYGAALADVNELIAEGGSGPSVVIEAGRIDLQPFQDAAAGVRATLEDFGRSDYQRNLAQVRAQFQATTARLLELGRGAADADQILAATGDAFQVFVLQQNDLLNGLRRTVLRDLISLYGSNGEQVREFGSELDLLGNGLRASTDRASSWAAQLERLETLDAASNIAQNLGDLFRDSGLTFAEGIEEYSVPLLDLLEDLGVSFDSLTSPASIAAFGRAARLLGLSAEELASASGVDLSGLTPAQRASIDAQASAKPDANAPIVGGLAKVAESTDATTDEVQMQTVTLSAKLDRLIAAVVSLRGEGVGILEQAAVIG